MAHVTSVMDREGLVDTVAADPSSTTGSGRSETFSATTAGLDGVEADSGPQASGCHRTWVALEGEHFRSADA
jgi:hypothetical protein